MIAIYENKNLPLGRVVATPEALDALVDSGQSPDVLLHRHSQGDWGDVCADDWESNDMAYEQGDRILSSYKTVKGIKIWIITEWDRSATTILLPGEY